MDGFTTFTAVGLLIALLIQVQNLIRYAKAKDANGVLGLLLAVAGGVAVAFVAAQAEVTASLTLIEGSPDLGHLDGGSLTMLGVALGTGGSMIIDVLKALDNNNTVRKPALVDTGQE